MSVVFLTVDEVVAIQRDQVERYGGLPVVRDAGLLESAVAMPRAAFAGQYLHRDLFDMAAAYLFHIVQNHPFADANKRTGTVAADVFLALNGVRLVAAKEELLDLVLSVARGETEKAAVSDFLRANADLA